MTKTEYGYRLRGQEYALTEPVVTAFRTFLREHPEFYLSDAQYHSPSRLYSPPHPRGSHHRRLRH